MNTAEHLDAALEHLRAIGHGCHAQPLTRQHIEFACAHIRQAWIDDDGQIAADPAKTHNAVAAFYRFKSQLAPSSG